jgi:CubicO group peptidase (beta-lactamase class C family)
MNRTPASRLLVALALCLLVPLASAFDAARYTGIVERGMADWQVPGLAVAVVEDGAVAYARGFGTTALDGGVAVDVDTPFANASTTKAMVAAGILMLVDEGRLALDVPVIEYLPQLHFADPALTQQVTLRDLLSHRTGMPSTDFLRFMQGMTAGEQMAQLRFIDPVAAPRSRLIYQNTQYEIAALVLERVTGRHWGDFLAERLWAPIGMRDTFAKRGDIPAGRPFAMPHDVFDGKPRAVEFSRPPQEPNAAGSAWSTIADMARWAQFLLRGGVTEDGQRLLSAEAFATWFEPNQLAAPEDFYPVVKLTQPRWRSYALGWFQQDFAGQRIDFHTGSLAGLVAIIGLDRDAGRAVIVMANRDHAELRHALLWEALDPAPEAARRDWHGEVLALYRDQQAQADAKWEAQQASRLAGVPASLPAADYVGLYESTAWGELRIEPSAGGLQLLSRNRRLSLSHWHADLFLASHPDWHKGRFLRFSITPAGEVEALEFAGYRFDRVED